MSHAQSPCSGTPSANSILPSSAFTICSGTSATLSLANTYSTSGITYSWSSSTTSTVGPWSPVTGANARNYLTPPLTNTNGLFYMVTITCTNSGQSITIPVTISVVPCYTPCSGQPSNTLVPASQTLCSGSTVSLSFAQTYSLTTGNSFQWYLSSSASGPFSPIGGATASTYSTPTPGSTTYYLASVTCSNGGQGFTTTPVAVNIVTCTGCVGTPASNTITGPSTVCAGSATTLNLAYTYTNSGITYHWQSSTISPVGPFNQGPTTTISTFVTPTLNTTTYYNVVITCTNGGQSYTAMYTLSVVSCPTACVGYPAASAVAPANQTLCAGAAASLALNPGYASITGLTFQWMSSTASSGPFSPVASPGGTATTYTTGSLASTMYYQVVITCTNVSAGYTTAIQPVTVVTCTNCFGSPAATTIVPISPTICSGTSATLGLANTYTGAGMTYQWQSSTLSIAGPYNPVSGATSSIYITPSLTTTTFYQVIITCTASGQSTQTSTTVYVVDCSSVCAGAPGGNTVLPASQTVCTGGTATMGLAVTYTEAGMAYQWYAANGASGPFIPITGATLTTYTTSAIATSMYYQVIITCSTSSMSTTVGHTLTAVNCGTITGFENSDLSQLRVYPNPATDEIILEGYSAQDGVVLILDPAGRMLCREVITPGKTRVSVKQLEPGLYFIRLPSCDQKPVIRFLRE